MRRFPMWMHIPVLITLALPGTSPGTSPGASPAKSDTTAVKAELMAADRALAQLAARGGAEVVLRALDPRAAVLFPGQPVLRGAAESRAPFIARYSKPSTFAWRPVHAVAGVDGRFGCTFGYSRFFNSADTLKSARKGTYITCWEKARNGKWRIVGTERNDSPPGDLVLADTTALPGAPHSATTSFQGSALIDAQDADSLFAVFGERPSGPAPAFLRYIADDGLLIGPTEFPRGKAGVEKAFEGYPSADRVITWRPLRSFGAGSGGLAFTVGHSVSGPRPGKTGRSVNQKYMSVWRQE
ncbi:MAG: nuclear transport factor 2 family protein, partial [Gemmatimonadales bacterium]